MIIHYFIHHRVARLLGKFWACLVVSWAWALQLQCRSNNSSSTRLPWAQAATFSFQVQTSKQIGRSIFKTKIFAQLFRTNLCITFFFFYLVLSSQSLLLCWSCHFFSCFILLHPVPLTCNLVCPRP